MFRSSMTIIKELYLYLTTVIFMLYNTHAAVRHAAISPNTYNDVILPNVLT